MFIIIGGDGKEYGPVTTEQIRAWIAAGRASRDTKAKALGSEEWRRLGDFPEFSAGDNAPPIIGAASRGETGAPGATAELAGIGARIGGALINALVYVLALLPGVLAMSAQLIRDNPQLAEGGLPKLDALNLTATMEHATMVRVGLMLALFVQCALLAWRGQNLGKLATGNRVVRADNGERASFFRAGFLRFLVPVGIIITLNVLFPLGFLFLLVDFCFIFRGDRRCLHDLVAGTKVVKV